MTECNALSANGFHCGRPKGHDVDDGDPLYSHKLNTKHVAYQDGKVAEIWSPDAVHS